MTRAHLVCETHWDREWYLTKEEFGVKLVRLMDGLLDIVEKTPGYVSFMMDGQTIALEDYLRARPRNRERLKKAVSSGKIAVGPWYVLPDELLVSGESHIRNYLAGDAVVRQFGRKNNIGYLPDSFGHPEQMPQILKGLGVGAIVFWRGTGKGVKKTEFRWASPNPAASVLAVHMPYGYGNSARLSPDITETAPRLDQMIDALRMRSTTDAILLMNGSDHVLPQADIVDIIAAYNEAAPKDRRIIFSTIEAFLADLAEAGPALETLAGEFRSGDRDMVLSGTLSTRVYLKQRNIRAQRVMERCLEPLASIESLLSLPAGRRVGDFLDYQNLVWKKILENHPHDSICGCSVDAVHDEMLTRFDCVDQLQATLVADVFADLETSLAPVAGPGPEAERSDAQLLYFESSQDRLPVYREFDVDFDATLVNRVNFARSMIEDFEPGIDHLDLPAGVTARDQHGRDIPCALVTARKAYHMDLQDDTLPEVHKVNRCRVALLLPPFDYGLHVVRLRRAATDSAPPTAPTGAISNEFYSVDFDPADAAFTIVDKETGRVHRGVGRVCDLSDSGDEYSHSWVENERPFSLDPARLRWRCSGRQGIYEEISVEGTLALPECVTLDRKGRSETLCECPVRLCARVYRGVRRVDMGFEIDNKAKDHRLQVEIPSGSLLPTCSSSTAFAVTERPVTLPVPEVWVEYPQNCHPTHGFIHAGGADHGVSVSAESTNEFESVDQDGQTVVRLTLLRCVGWLSRPDLYSRKGNGGWNLPTPGAQCSGLYRFEYSVIYHKGSFREAGAFGIVDRKQNAVDPFQLRKTRGDVAVVQNPAAFVSGMPAAVRLSALKFREKGGGLVFRIHSIAEAALSFRLDLPDAVASVNAVSLDERVLEPVAIEGRSIGIRIEPAEILSFEFLVP